MYYFCTYFDYQYLNRGLALYRSLRRHCSAFKLWVLCMDGECHGVLSQLALPDIHLIAIEDFERGDDELLLAKQNRSWVEYYFTCTPSLPLFVLNHWPQVDVITYLDADLFFFADPVFIFEEIANHSIGIIGHRFPLYLRDRERHGIYNVGWLSFRRDENAFACLSWWRARCLEWCFNESGSGRFADQKYLDNWPSSFQSTVVLQHKGGNLAPWNLANYKIHADGNRVYVDEQSLIFYHFHGFKPIRSWLYNLGLADYGIKRSAVVLRHIYQPYIRELLDVTEQVSSLGQVIPKSSLRGQTIRSPLPQSIPLLRYGVRKVKGMRRLIGRILSGSYICVLNGHII